MPPPYKVLDFKYPGLPEIARTAIRQLAPEGEWESSYGDRVELYEHKRLPDGNLSPHYGEWALRLKSNDPQDRSRCATIEVRELWGELLPWGEPKTVLIFLDARDATWTLEKPEPMGDVLKGLYRAVHGEVHRIAGQRAAQAEAQVTTLEGGSRNKPRGMNIGTAARVAEALLRLKIKGHKIKQQTACELAGVSPKTLRKYQNDPDVLDELERLRQDKDLLDEIRNFRGNLGGI